MASCAKAAERHFLVPLPNVNKQNSEDGKSAKSRSYLKAFCSKAKNGAKCNHKRNVCSSMGFSSIEPEFNVITLSDRGKLVLRRSSFDNQAPKACSPYEYLMLENLLGVSLDVKEKENVIDRNIVTADSTNHQNYKERNELSSKRKNSMEKRDFVSNRRMQRRHAIVQIAPNTRDVLLEKLRALALERSLVHNGLLK